ncbi:MAG TPA: hypothetical protein ENJ56_04615 [Anaerolineae bacterium]|nr:hypothetical protein [Anaerolineae bacterium]
MKESDWKKFKVIREKALDEFCKRVLVGAEEIIADEATSAHERYLTLYKFIDENDKDLAAMFDNMRRSLALIHLRLMRTHKLVSDETLAELSADMQNRTKPLNF